MHRTGKGKTFTVGQNLGPDAPAIVRDLETDVWLDFSGNRARFENRLRMVGGIPIHTRTVVTGDSGYGWNAATNASTRLTPTGGTGLRNNLRRDPLRVIVSALARAETARSLVVFSWRRYSRENEPEPQPAAEPPPQPQPEPG